ncbi:FBP domain-containing protein [Micromonospora okii]|uniref:FBP domain-containing protein n=1 Tax=Micromonospora okii TaxID=1182970 RepID=UPI001E3214FB|nr:FBP domain-containing protein [Micromonospora okii]
MSRDEVRGAIANREPVGSRVRLPSWFDEIAWDKLDYLGWRDPRAPMRAYLVADVDGVATGLLLRQNPNQAELGGRSVMCSLCHFMRRFNEVALFAAPRPSADKRQRLSTLGILVCTDLDCATKVHSTPLLGPYDPPLDEIIQSRREGLRARTVAFLRSVSSAQRSVRGRG